MRAEFSFNSKILNLWDIYEAIKKFYPIGLSHNEGVGIYFEYQGLKDLEKIIVENIHNAKNYRNRWVKFEKQLEKEVKKEVAGTTYGQAPSFSASIILETHQKGSVRYAKELHFSVSLVGKFYQIYGLDFTTLLEYSERRRYSFKTVVTVSPFEEYKELFDIVEQKNPRKISRT